MFGSEQESRTGLGGEASVGSFVFIAITVVLTAIAAWLFGSGLGRDRAPERELSGSGPGER